jgi:hypothetical protein
MKKNDERVEIKEILQEDRHNLQIFIFHNTRNFRKTYEAVRKNSLRKRFFINYSLRY